MPIYEVQMPYKEKKEVSPKRGLMIGIIVGALVSGGFVYPLAALHGHSIGYDRGHKEERLRNLMERVSDYLFRNERKRFEPGSVEESNYNALKNAYVAGFIMENSNFTRDELERTANEGLELRVILKEHINSGTPLPPEVEKYFK
ncbi:MAG TPA: hypothetical protein VI564_07690 [Candidatus Nanoarchaeia archaeon]|nr:hypothetical protein [Candidatus Nanoarchaeia archaeon]